MHSLISARARAVTLVLTALFAAVHIATQATRPAAGATSLPVPSSWNIYANGEDGHLNLLQMGANNVFSATLELNRMQFEIIGGFWDEEDRTITFHRGQGADRNVRQVYTGHLLTWDSKLWLTGSFEAMASFGGSGERWVFGWYAEQIRGTPGNCWCGLSGAGKASLPLNTDIPLISNGTRIMLRLTSISASGNVVGQIISGASTDATYGYWDYEAQRLIFVRGGAGPPEAMQIYTGYLMSLRGNNSGSYDLSLAGSFEAFQNAGGTPQRSVYGWFAEL